MVILQDKKALLEEFKAKYVDGYFEKIHHELNQKINDKKEEIKREILNEFKEIFTKAEVMQKEKLKGEIKYIYISYLRTGLLENKGIYRIDLYDNKWFLDKEECFSNIDLSLIYESLFYHMSDLNYKRKYNKNITEIDVEKIKLKEADKYHKICMKFLKNIIDEIVKCSEYTEINNSNDIDIYAGEYRDEAMLLFKRSEEKLI